MARAIGMANGAALMISFRDIRYIQARRGIFKTVFSFWSYLDGPCSIVHVS